MLDQHIVPINSPTQTPNEEGKITTAKKRASRKRKKSVDGKPQENPTSVDNQQEHLPSQPSSSSSAACTYFPYDPDNFSPLQLFRTQTDAAATLIANSGSEGLNRYEIGEKLRTNAHSKSGNRRISESINAILKLYPDRIGQYQKMEGKFRTYRYFAKNTDQTPGGVKINGLFERFEQTTGKKFPYKLNDAVKFRELELGTLRISDVNLRRMCDLVELIQKEKIIITRCRLERIMSEYDASDGLSFKIDKKSLQKILLALERHNLLKIMQIIVTADEKTKHFAKDDQPDSEKTTEEIGVEIFVDPEIKSSDDSRIAVAVEATRKIFHNNGQTFPLGYLKKKFKEETIQEPKKADADISSSTLAVDGGSDATENCRVSLPNFSVIIEKSMLHDEIRKIDLEKNKLAYGSGKRNRSLLPKLSHEGIHTLVETLDLRQNTKNRKKSKIQQNEPQSEKKLCLKRKLEPTYKKRPYDETDLNCLELKTFMSRSTFTPRERNMLVLIRAFSFFLNPTPRFWPDTHVYRDLMHEFVPESRLKTAIQLMSAGIRELKHPSRFSYHQFAVKIFASYPQILKMRNELATLSLKTEEKKKNEFFAESFRIVYKIIFDECDTFSYLPTNDQFDEFLSQNNLSLSKIEDRKFVPFRSSCPITKEDIQYCVGYNAVISAIIGNQTDSAVIKTEEPIVSCEQIKPDADSHSDPDLAPTMDQKDLPNQNYLEIPHVFSNKDSKLLHQIDSSVLLKILEHLRTDCLIARERQPHPSIAEVTHFECKQDSEIIQQLEPDFASMPSTSAECESMEVVECKDKEENKHTSVLTLRKQVIATQLFRLFFGTSYCREVTSLTASAVEKFSIGDTSSLNDTSVFENPGEFLALMNYLDYDEDKEIEINFPNLLDDLFINADDTNNSKQLRYLEESELRLNRITIHPAIVPINAEFHTTALTATKIPENILGSDARDFSLNGSFHEKILSFIDSFGFNGVTMKELTNQLNCQTEELEKEIKIAIQQSSIISCGIEQRKYVSSRNAKPWLLFCKTPDDSEKFGFVPRPWICDDGSTNYKTARDMCEGVFSAIETHPGILFDHLIKKFIYVLQPTVLEDLVEFLVEIKSCVIKTVVQNKMTKSSPFLDFDQHETIRYITSLHNGFERVGLFFSSVKKA